MAKAHIEVAIIKQDLSEINLILTSYKDLEKLYSAIVGGDLHVSINGTLVNLIWVSGIYTKSCRGVEFAPHLYLELSYNDKVIRIPFQGKQYFNQAKATFDRFIELETVFFKQANSLPACLDLASLDWDIITFKEVSDNG